MTTHNARVILPAEATVEMIAAFWRQKNTGTQDIGEAGDATSDFDAYTSMLAASPARGKVTEAEVERAARALCERDIRNKRRFDTSPEHLEGMLPRSVDFHWRDYVPEARVVCAALGLEVE